MIETRRLAGRGGSVLQALGVPLATPVSVANTVSRKQIVLLAALMAAVLAGSAGGVAAQSATGAPVSFTGQVQLPGQDCGEGATFQVVGEVEQLRGFRCDRWMGTSDPRFTGTYVTVADIDTYHGGEFASPNGPLRVSTVMRRVENEEGAWQGTATTTAWVEPAEEDGEIIASLAESLVFSGQGAYEGLTAVVWLSPMAANAHVRGVIFAGAPPPAPSLPDPAGSH